MERCVYCHADDGDSADHVPPKAFFPRARRSNLLTVPSCTRCNNALSKDEEYVLAALMFSDAGVSLVGKELWNERISRMFEKNKGLRRRFARDFHQVELRTPAGIFLEHRTGFNYDAPRFTRVMEKIVRGLYFEEFNERLPVDCPIASMFLHTPGQFQVAARLSHQLLLGGRIWPRAFEYRFGRVKDKPVSSGWLLRFYDSAVFLVVTNITLRDAIAA
jgi:hypothetical protein